ncbi:MAG TPA: GNAT family N-acetyltransferase [Gemmatimonadales bacterium]|nr:GNAT family N-acetyltransferase [Gemmatimonadales bacterium]
MPIAYRHREDPVHPLTLLPGLVVHRETDVARMAALQGRTEAEIRMRLDAGHRAYVAEIDGIAAAWGWVATGAATIGELEARFTVAPHERYLWNFLTLPAYRGKGIYPRLIASIVDAEAREAEGFWIAFAPENHASGAGIRKAGFEPVAELSFDPGGVPVVKALVPDGGRMAAALLGLPESHETLALCWKCVRAKRPTPMSCATGACACDYQRPDTACAA